LLQGLLNAHYRALLKAQSRKELLNRFNNLANATLRGCPLLTLRRQKNTDKLLLPPPCWVVLSVLGVYSLNAPNRLLLPGNPDLKARRVPGSKLTLISTVPAWLSILLQGKVYPMPREKPLTTSGQEIPVLLESLSVEDLQLAFLVLGGELLEEALPEHLRLLERQEWGQLVGLLAGLMLEKEMSSLH
jgi:hypothetical protein